MKNKKLFSLENEGNLFYIINKINRLILKEENILKNFFLLDRVFSFFYNQKVYIKRTGNKEKFFVYQDYFLLLDLKKIEKIFILLEDLEVDNKQLFINFDGVNLLLKVKAKYFHCKRFFITRPFF